MRRTPPVLRSVITVAAALAAAIGLALPPAAAADRHGDDGRGHGNALAAKHSLRGPNTEQNFYFVMGDRFANGSTANDTGGLGSDPLVSGFDPTRRGFYQGGDLKGLTDRLGYIQDLGATSIWLTPIFKNKAVQLEDGPSAGYHGYWITDFTQVDPHLGTNQDLSALVSAAHQRGLKVYFDIIANHTADVISYPTTSGRSGYVSKDAVPYKTASGQVFDDRDFAGTNRFPALDPATSFPLTPTLTADEQKLKVPAWLNDVTRYHNRGDTTFTGENSQYGDFFGLDDLFTEDPRVVRGMTDIYQTWIKDFGIDGYRVDTMKHVNDEFWKSFAPGIARYARAHGKPDFFMFGEVALDGSGPASKAFTSHYTTQDKVQAILDFPFQDAARGFASRSGPATNLAQFFDNDDWYTDADSNAYELPTFLGNHDMGRIGNFVRSDNGGAAEPELLSRDRLAHQLMYLSRGNPIVYYGDEQGFTGDGGDQGARQTMFASKVADYLDDDLLGTDSTHAVDNFNPNHPLFQSIRGLADLTTEHPALRNGAQQPRFASDGPGVYAFSRVDRREQREYVVALNNSESAVTAAVPTYVANGGFTKVYGDGSAAARTAANRTLSVTVPALSTIVLRADRTIPRSSRAPEITLDTPTPAAESNSREHVVADVDGSSFYEVTFYARSGHGRWRSIGTDDSAPYQVFHDTSALRTGTRLEYQAVVLDNARHTRTSRSVRAAVPAPVVKITTPAADGSKARDVARLTAEVDPERGSHEVTWQRSVAGGPFVNVGTDTTSPVYSLVDDFTALGLAPGTVLAYRAVLRERGGGTVTSPVRTIAVAPPPITTATLHYFRPAGDYGVVPNGWGLHLFGNAIADGVATAWEAPRQRVGVEPDGWATYTIPLKDDTAPLQFIMHLPAGDNVPTTREPGGDRSFVPLDSPEVWLKAGDTTIYTSKPPTP